MVDGTAAGLHRPAESRLLLIGAVCVTYISMSASLIRFNKYLVAHERFPYPMALSAIHMACSLFLCSGFYLVRPSAFPSMSTIEGKQRTLGRWFLPIGFTFAVSLYASNRAYMYANVTFLQFMKEGNVVIIFLMSCAAGLQAMNRVKFANIVWISVFAALCVGGELNFVWMGFTLQLLSQVAECSRVVLGECVLSGSSLKLDPLTYTLFAAPVCLAVLLLGNYVAWDPAIVPRAVQLWHLLLPNAVLAFVLNLLVTIMVKEVSAVGAILTGVVKDVCLVLLSAAVFGEAVTRQQVGCFAFILLGILFWSTSKLMPKHPAVRWVEDTMSLPRADEQLPLKASGKH